MGTVECEGAILFIYLFIMTSPGAREITNGPRHRIWSEGDNHFLTVMDVFGEDADEYVCRAVNKAGVKSTRAELLIMSEYITW